MTEHGAAHVSEKLAYVAGQGGVQNPVSYLTAALRDDYKKGVPDARRPVKSERGAKLARVRDLAGARTPTQRDADKRLFLTQLESAAARDDFDRHGWMSALNYHAIVAFWAEMVPES